jgi:hypothetical protein
MTTAACLLVLSLFPQAPATGRTPVEAPPRPAVDAVVEALEKARAELRAWRTAAEQGAPVDEVELGRVFAAVQGIGEELQALRARMELSRPQKPAPPDTVASGTEAEREPATARELSRVFVEDLRALGPGADERRVRGRNGLAEALASGDDTREWAALLALAELGDVELDRASLRPLVLPFARSARPAKRVSALYALASTGCEPGDLALVHAAWKERTPEIDASIAHLLLMFGERRIEGRSEEIVLELLSGTVMRGRRASLSGLWGAQVGDRLAARLIELSRDPRERHDALYFGLSTLQEKNAAVVDVLIEALQDPDHNNSGRALWGLGHGVPVEHQARVAEALLELHGARSDPRIREDCERIVRAYGGEAMAARLAR